MDAIEILSKLKEKQKRQNEDGYVLILTDISWSATDLQSMIKSQCELNSFILRDKFIITNKYKKKIMALQRDMENYYTSKCSICGHCNSSLKPPTGVDHYDLNLPWGCNKNGQNCKLILCEFCCNKHIYNGSMKEFLSI